MPTQAPEIKESARLTAQSETTAPRRASVGRSLGSLLIVALPAVATGGLLWLSYFPVAWGWLGWVALVPLLFLVRSRAPAGRVFLAALLGGLVFFLPALQWMRVADPQMYYTWVALAIYCSLYIPIALVLMRHLDRRTRLPLVVTAPVVWTALEFLRSHLAEGFPWYLLSHTQHDFLPVIQISDLTGAYGVTFLLVAVNALIVAVLFRLFGSARLTGPAGDQKKDSILGLVVQTAVVAILVAGTLLYGNYRLHQEPFSKGPRVALIQSNLEQGIRNAGDSANPSADLRAGQTMKEHYQQLQELAAQQNAELIVWPETSHVQIWQELSQEHPASEQLVELAHWNKEALAEARACRTNVLFGFSAFVVGPSEGQVRRYNSAVLVDAEGRYIDRYDKMHRVPFGEYIPFVDWLPWLKVFSPYGEVDYSIRPGEQFTHFPVGSFRFGAVICFEDSDAALARQYAGGDGASGVDFLLNISNDGWFKGTSEHEQHLAISRFRAVECRRSLARAVNMGISAIIDSNGRVLAPEKLAEEDMAYTWKIPDGNGQGPALPLNRWSEFKKVKGVVTGTIPIDHRISWYARWGDWLPWSCWLCLATLLVFGWSRAFRRVETASP